MERSFETAQDRLVKGLRIANASTLEQANAYLESEYLPEWEEKFTVMAACADNAHRPLAASHDLEAILSHVEERVVTNDYTVVLGNSSARVEREKQELKRQYIGMSTVRNQRYSCRSFVDGTAQQPWSGSCFR